MRTAIVAALVAGFSAGVPAARAAPLYHLERKIALPDGGWDLANFDPVTRRIYLARTDAVMTLDVDAGAVATLAPANHSHAVVPVDGGAQVMVTDGGTDTARFIDARTGAEIAAVKVGHGPDAALLDPATGLGVVMNAKSGDVTLIDPKTHAVAATIAVGGALEIAAADGRGRVFVNVEDRNELAVLDLKDKSVRRAPLTGCERPTGIAFLPVSGQVMSACANGVAVLTDARTLKVTRTLPIGQGPDTVMYDAVRRRALVPCGRSGDLDIFADTATGVRAEGSVATQIGARTGALDSKTGRAYLPAADYTPAAKPGGWPQIKPGSVTMLVIAP